MTISQPWQQCGYASVLPTGWVRCIDHRMKHTSCKRNLMYGHCSGHSQQYGRETPVNACCTCPNLGVKLGSDRDMILDEAINKIVSQLNDRDRLWLGMQESISILKSLRSKRDGEPE